MFLALSPIFLQEMSFREGYRDCQLQTVLYIYTYCISSYKKHGERVIFASVKIYKRESDMHRINYIAFILIYKNDMFYAKCA